MNNVRWLLRRDFLHNAIKVSGLRSSSLISRRHKSESKESLPAKQYTLRRSVLYVPGNDERKIDKISSINVDCVLLDCEDGVAANQKESARKTIRKVLDEDRFKGTDCAIRVNSIDSELAEKDIDEIFEAKTLPTTVMVPKIETAEHVTWAVDHISRELKERKYDKKLNLLLYIESAKGLADLKEILTHAKELSEFSRVHLDGIVFGSDDFTADIGAVRSRDAKEVLMARQAIVLYAKLFKIQAIDMVYIDYKDLDGLQQQSLEGAGMGFTGKQVIHPSQVPIVQAAFTPPPEKVAWAKELIQLFEEHQKSGKGAFTFKGSMIDMPTLLQAKNLVDLDEMIKTKAEPEDLSVESKN